MCKTVKTVKTGVKTGVKTVSLRVKTVKTFVPLKKNYVFLFFRKNSFHGFHTPASGFHNSFHGFHTSSHTPPSTPDHPPPPTPAHCIPHTHMCAAWFALLGPKHTLAHACVGAIRWAVCQLLVVVDTPGFLQKKLLIQENRV